MAEPPRSLPGEDLPVDVAEALGTLYAGAPDGFVAGRDRLAADLKARGENDLAARVRRLRRPTLAAWSLNRVAHEHPEIVGAFLDAARAVRAAQESGDDPAGLRRAIAAHRDARVAVLDATGDAARDEVAATIDAAALDESIGSALAAGRLERAAAAGSAFQVLSPNPAAVVAPATKAAERPLDSARRRREQEREAARDARILAAAARVDEARRRVEEAQAALDAADVEVRRARKALDATQSARDKAERALAHARLAEQRAQDLFDRT